MCAMKTSLLLLLALSSLVSLFSVSSSKAQEYAPSGDSYYYNNFDGGNLGTKFAQIGATAALGVSNVDALSGAYSLSSTGATSAGGLQTSFFTNSNLNNEQFGNEWTLVYRNNSSSNPEDSETITNGKNAWKYWLFTTNNSTSSPVGYYLTQVGSTLYIKYYQDQYNKGNVVQYNIANNTTYVIRIQRLKRDNGKWQLYVDPYSPTQKQATTLRVTGQDSRMSNYAGGALFCSSTNAGRFKFDEIKAYSIKLQISGANDASYGITTPLYAGQTNAIIYGLKVDVRGLMDITQLVANISGADIGQIFDGTMYLRKSFDSFFGNADDVGVTTLNYYNGGIQNSSFNDKFYSVGADNGALVTSHFYYFMVNVKANPLTSSFSFASVPTLFSGDYNVNYASGGSTVVNVTTPPTASGNVYDWIGDTPVWSAASNWRYPNNTEPSTAPGPNDLVRIGVNKTFSKEPMLNASTTIGNLIIAGTTASLPSIKINGTNTLTVSGSFTNQTASAILGSGSLAVQGNWTTSGGKLDLTTESVTVKFTGTKSQTITDQGSDSGNGVVFGNVEFSGGGTKTLGGSGKFAVAIGKFLTMGASTILDAAGKLTLKAGISGTASVGVIPANSSIRGQVTVEKYVQGGSKDMWRTYRMWSSPVYDNTANFTNANTVGNRTYNFTQFIDDVIITGTGGAANGFDVNLTNNASAWTYNNGFIAIPNINTSINIGRGAYLYYRGNRNNFEQKINAPYIDAESMIITFKGTLNQQSVTVPLVHGSTGFSMLGNPYAATIDWNAITKSANIDKVMRMWNPAFRQYATFNGEFGVNGGSNFIGPGQAFFVTTKDNSSPFVTFNENSKVTVAAAPQTPAYNVVMNVGEKSLSSNNAVMAVNGGVQQLASTKIRVKLLKVNAENADETLIVLRENEKSDYADSDVPRSGGETVFLSSLSTDAKELAINYMPEISAVSSIPLSVNASSNGNYLLEVELTDLPLGYSVQLKDKYLGSLTGLVANGNSYSLTIDKAKATSFGANRFELLIAPPTSLPVVFKEFKGSAVNEGVRLSWSTSSETDNDYFEVFRAGEEQIYTSIGTVPANEKGAYSLLDKTPLKGNNYYKLTQVDKNGKSSEFPDLVVVKYDLNGNTLSDIAVYPTLVQTTFTVKYNGSANATSYLLRVSDATGKEIYKKGVDKNDLINGVAGDLSVSPKGAYFVAVFDSVNGNKIGTAKIIKK